MILVCYPGVKPVGADEKDRQIEGLLKTELLVHLQISAQRYEV